MIKKGENGEITPENVLGVFLALQELDADSGDVITNLKAQKLLYYAQGWSFAKLGKQLFDENFEAWQYGPVIPRLYKRLKVFESKQIKLKDNDIDLDIFDDKQRQLLISVYKTYGQFSAWKLRDMTHQESPWKDAFRQGELDILIPKNSIRDYFVKLNAAQN